MSGCHPAGLEPGRQLGGTATDPNATVISNASITAKNVKIRERENGALLKERIGFGHESGSHPGCQVSGNIQGGRNEHSTDYDK